MNRWIILSVRTWLDVHTQRIVNQWLSAEVETLMSGAPQGLILGLSVSLLVTLTAGLREPSASLRTTPSRVEQLAYWMEGMSFRGIMTGFREGMSKPH